MKMTERKLLDLILAGYGQGHGNNYRPFLKNTRSAISKKGTQSSGKVFFALERSCDFKSRQEKKIARALQWLGAVDVREQFPIWPMPHAHPLRGAPGAELMTLVDAKGLLEIAEQAGICHGVWPGSNIPYVATIDFMVTVFRNHTPGLVAVECKDREIVLEDDPLSRPRERLELARLYSKHLQIPHVIVNREVFGKVLLANLEWLIPDEKTAAELVADPCLSCFFDFLRTRIFRFAIDGAVEGGCRQVGWPKARGFSAFRYLAWTQDLDIDLSRPVVMTQRATGGGKAIRHLLQHEILGEIDHG